MEMGTLARSLSDKELISKFKDDCLVRGLSFHTIEGYVSNLNLFSSFLKKNGYNLFSVDREILRKYLAHLRKQGINDKTIKNRFSAFSSLFEYTVYEGLMERNVVLDIRKRYLRSYKFDDSNGGERKLISIKEMSSFIDSIFDIRDKAIALLLAKTGVRRTELMNIDLDEIDWTLKPTHKRSNRVVFFDFETSVVLRKWINKRNNVAAPNCKALFISYNTGERVARNGVYNSFVNWAVICGLHDPTSKRIEDHFTPHCCRHWFTTHLRRAGMPRDFIKELRGDKRRDAMDVYYHIDKEELRKSYLACIPQLGV
jgi:integrase/recombinase XerD